jgi:sortase A
MSAMLEHQPRTLVHSGRIDASPPPGRDQERTRVGVAHVLLSLSLLLVWAAAYLFVLSGFEQGHAQHRLYAQLRTELAEGTAPTGAPVPAGDPVALLSIPAAGLRNEVVVEGTRPGQLQHGPGHLPGTVLPGQQGASFLAGRSETFGAPFGRIAELRPGTPVTVTTAQGQFRYAVTGVRREGDPMPAAPAAGTGRLTLMTMAGSHAGLGAAQILYVDADLAEGAAPAGPTSLRDPDDRMLAAGLDTVTLAFLALSLQLLLVTSAGFVWAWSRWSRTAAWIAGAPCVLAALWLASSIGSRLLPGLV